MRVTKRDALVLAVFTLLVAGFAGGSIYLRTRPPDAEEPSDRGPADLARPDESAELTELRKLATTAGSDVFRPLTFELASLAPGQAKASGPVTPSHGSGRRAEQPTPTPYSQRGPYGGPPGSRYSSGFRPPTPRAEPADEPAEISLALTGVMRDSQGLRALVEDREAGSQFVRVGTEAFGYKLRYLTLRGGVFERNGRFYVLVVGQNKRRASESKSGESSSKPTPSSSSYHVEMQTHSSSRSFGPPPPRPVEVEETKEH